MVEGRQGDIFEAWRMGSYDVIVLFGHKGFSALSTVLEFNRPFQPTTGRLHLPERPGDSFDARPIELKEGGWFVGCANLGELIQRALVRPIPGELMLLGSILFKGDWITFAIVTLYLDRQTGGALS